MAKKDRAIQPNNGTTQVANTTQGEKQSMVNSQAVSSKALSDPSYLTKKKAELQAIKQQRLTGGPWDLRGFSPPGEGIKCDHPIPRVVVPGGLPVYYCDECEHYLLCNFAHILPKQHIPAYHLFALTNFLAYEGAQVTAELLQRPHIRLDQPDHPSLAPIEILREYAPEWREMLQILGGKLDQIELEGVDNYKELSEGDKEE